MLNHDRKLAERSLEPAEVYTVLRIAPCAATGARDVTPTSECLLDGVCFKT